MFSAAAPASSAVNTAAFPAPKRSDSGAAFSVITTTKAVFFIHS